MNLETSTIEVGIITLLDNYFELMHTQNMDLFDKVFHPDCSLFGTPDDKYNVRTAAVYKEQMINRESPASKGEARRDDSLSTSFSIQTPSLVCSSKCLAE